MPGFDTTPEPGFLLAMQNIKWTAAGALSELVDNGFGPGRGNAHRVEITHDTSRRIFDVLDNGAGMDEVGRLFKLGNTIGLFPKDIGKYGSGGTMALLWLARKVEIWTLRDGRVSSDAVDWQKQIESKEFPVISSDWKQASINNTPAALFNARHGTLIRLHLRQERKLYPSNVQRDLASTYAPATREGRELVWRTIGKNGGERMLGDPLDLPGGKDSVSFDLTLQIHDALLPVSGRIGLIEGLPSSRSHVAISFGPRVILKTRDCYGSQDGSQRYMGTGVAGWLELGDAWRDFLATHKDAIDNQPVWEALMGLVFERIQPLLARVEERELYLELDEIAVSLEQAFNGQAKIEVMGPTPPPRDEDSPEEDDEDDEDDDGDDAPERPKRPPRKDREQPTPAVSKIAIYVSTDEQMEGLLCKSEVWGDGTIAVEVNGDHHIVQTALRSHPVNRMALNLLVVREIAQTIATKTAVLERMFHRSALQEIDGRDEEQRAGLIARLLIDRVKVSSETAAA